MKVDRGPGGRYWGGALLALGLGLLYVLAFPQPPLQGDAAQYDAIAISLVKGNGFTLDGHTPTPVRPPVYPLFLAALYLLFGHVLAAVRVAQVLLYAALAAGTAALARLTLDERAAVPAGFLAAAYLPFLIFTGEILSEILFSALLMSGALLLLHALPDGRVPRTAAAGVLLGLATLCRPAGLLLPAFLFGVTTIGIWRPARRSVRMLAVVVAAATLTIVPWTMRNALRFRTLIPVSTGGGVVLWSGSYQPWKGIWRGAETSPLREMARAHPDPIEADRFFFQQGVGNILADPLGFIRLLPGKVLALWGKPNSSFPFIDALPDRAERWALRGLFYAVHLGTLVGALAGARRVLSPEAPGVLLLLVPIYFTGFHILLNAEPRYHLPAIPFVLALSSAGWMTGLGWLRGRMQGEVGGAA